MRNDVIEEDLAKVYTFKFKNIYQHTKVVQVHQKIHVRKMIHVWSFQCDVAGWWADVGQWFAKREVVYTQDVVWYTVGFAVV